MTNPIAIVTGGSRGIGAATVRMLARRGYDVAFTFLRDDKAAAHVFSDVEMFDRRAMALKAGCSDEAAILDLFAQVDEEFGAPALLVCNAANTGPSSRVDEVSYETLRMVADLNIVGPILLAKEAIKRMSTKHGGVGGAIVNVSSITSYLGSPADYVWYAASKGALNSFTHGLALEVAKEGIRVNAVSPGPTDTSIHEEWGRHDRLEKLPATIPMGRIARPDEIAAAICWLASDEASFVTGQVLPVSGGK
jgi:NAD(P)-dependent dehydrogenase (short-subunit alcohol dehydrogenase family)